MEVPREGCLKNIYQTAGMLVFLLACSNSFAAGTLAYEGWGFLKTADDRGTSAQTFVGGPDIETHGRWVDTKLDLKAYVFVADQTAFTAEAKNLYIASSTKLSELHQTSLGRRAYDWSQMDETWKMGVWSPRFLWDPLKTETVGMTGAFYQYRSQNWRAIAFASPVSVPERGFPTTDGDGAITSASPYFVNLPQKLRTGNTVLPIRYKIDMPSMGDILIRPEAAISTRYQPKQGAWGGLQYGYLPIHQVDMAVDAGVRPTARLVEVDIYPRFPMHHLLTAETGYRADFFQIWGSLSGERPEAPSNKANYIYNPMGPSLITSWGGSLSWQQGLTLHTSYLMVTEDKPASTSTSSTSIDLPSRYAYTKAWNFGGSWQANSYLTYEANWTYDVEKVSSLFSTDITFRKPLAAMSSWAVGVGADLINTSSGEGWIGRFEGNDRIRGKITYAF